MAPALDTERAQFTLRTFWADLPREGRWLLSTTAFQLLGRGMTLPFTVIYLHEVRGIGLDVAGSLMGLIGILAVVVAGPAGAATDRYGARAVSLFGCSLNVVGIVVLAFAATVPMAAVAMALCGASAVTWPAFNALVAAIVAKPQARQTYFGINFALVNLGIGLGGVIGGFYVDVDRATTFTTVFLIEAGCLMIPIALLLGPLRHVHGRAERPATDDGTPATYRGILRDKAFRWVFVLTFVAMFVGYGQMEAGMPAFARQVSEVSTRTIGWAFAANTLVIVLAQVLVLRHIAGRRRTRVLVVMSVFWAAAYLLLGSTAWWAGTTAAAACVIAFHALFGFGETLLQPTIPAMTNDLAPDHLRGRYNALSSGAFQAGAILGPVVAGLLLRHHLAAEYILVLVAGCALMVWLAFAVERRVSPRVNGVDVGPVSPG